MGDFNINLLNYDRRVETHDYVDAMFSNSLMPQITKPTNITPPTATVIGNIYRITNFVNTFKSKEYNTNNNIIFRYF